MAGKTELIWSWGNEYRLLGWRKVNGYNVFYDENRLTMIFTNKKGTIGSSDKVGG